MKIQFLNKSANEGFARVSVAAFVTQLDVTVEQLADIKTAVSEAVTNSIVHAYKNKIVYGCFPLAPMSAYALLHVSEIVGQNERTLFTFLSQNEEYTLNAFAESERNSFEFITVDYIYNYFEELFKK